MGSSRRAAGWAVSATTRSAHRVVSFVSLWMAVVAVLATGAAYGQGGTLAVTNGGFTDLTGLTPLGGPWYAGVPAGWTTAVASTNYSVFVDGTTNYGNLDALSFVSGTFVPLRQNVGTVALNSTVTLSFRVGNPFNSNVYYAAAAIYDSVNDQPLAVYQTNGAVTGFEDATLRARGVAAGTVISLGFWTLPGYTPGITNVSVVDAATTYRWNGNAVGEWVDGGGGWIDTYDESAVTWNNAMPVVGRFAGAAPTDVTVATAGISAAGIEVSSVDHTFSGGTLTMSGSNWTVGSGATATVANAVAGTAGLAKGGGGRLMLAGSNSYSGGTRLADGTLSLGHANALGSGAVTVNHGTLELNGYATTAVDLSGAGGSITLGGATLTATMATSQAYYGSISGSGNFVKSGPATLVLGGQNTYTGDTLIDVGSIFTAATNALPATTVLRFTQLSSPDSRLSLSGFSQTLAGADTSTGSGVFILEAAPDGQANKPATLTLDVAAGSSYTFTGYVRDAANTTGSVLSITKTGQGTQVFAGHPSQVTYSGTTTISGGMLEFSGGSNVANASPIVLAGGGVRFSGGGTRSTVISGSGSIEKVGDNVLTLQANTSVTGSTTVLAGRLELATNAALGSSRIVPLAGGTVSLTPALQSTVGGLAANAGGLTDVGNGSMTVAAGLSTADMLVALVAGRGDGSWNGTSGITSSKASADLAASVPRTVGWLDNGDGSKTFAFAAAGDSNLDWSVDILDAANFLAGGKFDSGTLASWNEGDFGYDGFVDILDAADFLSTGLFDAGAYNPASQAAGVAAVPEPSSIALLSGLAACFWLPARRRSR